MTDKMRDFLDEGAAESTSFEQVEQAQEAQEIVEAAPRFTLPAWLTAETGPGEVEEYTTHPLNFNGSKGLARILRGLTGMFGSLRYAAIDVLLGALQFGRERRALRVIGGAVRAEQSTQQGH